MIGIVPTPAVRDIDYNLISAHGSDFSTCDMYSLSAVKDAQTREKVTSHRHDSERRASAGR